MVWELPEVCGSSCLKPEGDASGFSVYFLLESQIVGQGTRDPASQNQTGVPFNRREPTGGSNQRNDMDFLILMELNGMKWGINEQHNNTGNIMARNL
jgi:hypothetical protein